MLHIHTFFCRIHTYGNRFFASDHPDSRAVFYEAATYSKRRINDLLKTLQGFEVAQNIHPLFKGVDCRFFVKKLFKIIFQDAPLHYCEG
jgi:hypothetical protein